MEGGFVGQLQTQLRKGHLSRKWEVGRLQSLLDKRSTFTRERKEVVFGGGEGMEEEIP